MMAETHTGPGGYKITKIDKKKQQTRGYGGTTALDGSAQGYRNQGYGNSRTTAGANMPIERQFDWDPQLKRYMNADDYAAQDRGWKPPAPPAWMPPTPPTPRRGGGGGGGGGGGYTAQQLAQQAALRQLIGSDMLKPMNVNPAFDADIATAKNAYSGIAGQVSKVDPYLGLVGMQAPQVRPEMEQFLQAQGVGTGDYSNAVDYANAQLAAGAQNWSGLAQTLGQNHLAAQQGVVDVANLQGQNIVSGLEAQRAATQLALQEQAKKQKLDLILQLIAAGGDVKGLI